MPKFEQRSPGRAGRGARACVLAACIAAGLCGPGHAATSASFQLAATIVSGCEINNVLPDGGQAIGQVGTLDFGEHSALSTDEISTSLAQNAALTLSCTPGIALTMSIDGGLHNGVSRNLQASGSTNRVPYSLYGDAGFSQLLSVNQAVPVSFANPNQIMLPVYGRLVLSGSNRADQYSDTVVVTLKW